MLIELNQITVASLLQGVGQRAACHSRPTNDRFLKFSCWLPVYFVARLLGINTLPLSPSQKTEVFQDSRK